MTMLRTLLLSRAKLDLCGCTSCRAAGARDAHPLSERLAWSRSAPGPATDADRRTRPTTLGPSLQVPGQVCDRRADGVVETGAGLRRGLPDPTWPRARHEGRTQR